ncbi:MAG TPA: Atu1372/SO_1960 family protein [Longimicrobiales bacterium]|nr:Atu1372/SO_1960 family protein [Longimicrobiales bacterium]
MTRPMTRTPAHGLLSAILLLAALAHPLRAQAPAYDPEARLAELGIVLPAAPNPVANYVNGVQTGNLIFLAGKGPLRPDGTEVRGKVGREITVEEGYQAARITAINQLAVLKAMLGDLSRVVRVVKVLGMVNADPAFVDQPAVINGFSDLIVEVFGERGRHARAAVGMATLPRGQAVEIEMVVEVAPESAVRSAAGREPLELTYFGAAGWRITDGEVVVLVDPWPSRLKYGGGGHPDDARPDFARTDAAWADTALIDALIPEADFILVQHGHFDHLGDVPYIARKTGAQVVGTETVTSILRAYGIPEDQLYPVQGGEDYQFDGFSVRVVPGLHSALDDRHYHDSRRYTPETPLEAPLRIEQFIEGGALSFLVRLGGRTVLTMGSMNFIEREFEGLEPDILLAGINGSRLGLYDYDRRLLTSTGFPPVVLPTHWDNFQVPYGFSQQENVERNLLPFMETARAVSPGSTVIIPVHLEPIVIR